MSVVSRVMRAGRALQSDQTHSPCSFFARSCLSLPTSTPRGGKATGPLMSSVITPEKVEGKKPTGMDERSSTSKMLMGLQLQSVPTKRRATPISWTLRAEMIIDRGLVGCRSFVLIAVAGSLIGSVLCFIEGCSFVAESILEFFITVSQRSDRGGILHLLIQALDMFLVGAALLTFGMSMYVMFIKSHETRQRRPQLAQSNLYGLFNLKRLSECIQIQSISEAKTRIGHVVVLILQAGLVDKFRDVPLTRGLDLACFAGALLSASATIFLLSRLTMHQTMLGKDVNKGHSWSSTSYQENTCLKWNR